MALVRRQNTTDQTTANAADTSAAKGLDPLTAELVSESVSIRRQAARALSALPEATGLLCAHLSGEPNLSVRSIIYTGIISQPSAAAVQGLLPLLRSEEVSLRNEAIQALQEMPNVVMPQMELALTDADSDVRIMATNVLAALHHPDAPARLLRIVAEDAHVNVCSAALDGLAEVGEVEAIPVLESLMLRFRDVAYIQFAARAAIRRIRGE
jgi:HEAT repeat protein